MSGNDAWTSGSDARTRGSDAWTRGNDARTRGSDAQTRGSDARTRGNDARTRGNDARTRGNDARTRGSDARTRGNDARTRGSDARTRGNDARTRGSDARTRGNDARTRGNDARTSGNEASGGRQRGALARRRPCACGARYRLHGRDLCGFERRARPDPWRGSARRSPRCGSYAFARPTARGASPSASSGRRRVGVGVGEVDAHPQHRLERDGARDHVRREPHAGPHAFSADLKKSRTIFVVALRLALPARLLGDGLPVGRRPLVELVEELRLEDPLLLLAAPAEAVDLVAERAVARSGRGGRRGARRTSCRARPTRRARRGRRGGSC